MLLTATRAHSCRRKRGDASRACRESSLHRSNPATPSVPMVAVRKAAAADAAPPSVPLTATMTTSVISTSACCTIDRDLGTCDGPQPAYRGAPDVTQRHERHGHGDQQQRRPERIEARPQKPECDHRQGHDDAGCRYRPPRRAAQEPAQQSPLAASTVGRDEPHRRGFQTDVAAQEQDCHPTRCVNVVAVARGTEHARNEQMDAEADSGADDVDGQVDGGTTVQARGQAGSRVTRPRVHRR